MNKPNDPETVFWERTQVQGEDDCWPWTGGLTSAGYGSVWIRGKATKASHIALEIHGKKRPPKALALHSCDNPLCVNPRHLRWGTHTENAADKMQRGRWRGCDPASLPHFKATPELVERVLSSDEGSTSLARRLGVSKPTVLRIRQRHGVTRRRRPPTVMMDRVLAHLRSEADANGLVTVKQTAVGEKLGMASSNVNIAIKLLVRDGLVVRVSKAPTGVWTYRIA